MSSTDTNQGPHLHIFRRGIDNDGGYNVCECGFRKYDTNKASEDELLRRTMYGVLHPEAQESFDNLVNGLACHYERLGKSITTAHAADKYTLEYVYDQLRSLIRTEKLKLLDEVIHQSTINLKSAKAVAGWAELRKKQLEAEL